MWQKFSERARKVVFHAQEEAARLGDCYVSTEHLLLGMVKEQDSSGVRALCRLGMNPIKVEQELFRQITPIEGDLAGDMQLTPRCKRVIDLAYEEARQFGHSYIGTEHLLLAFLKEGEGMAARTLAKLGLDYARARDEVERMLEAGEGEVGTRGSRLSEGAKATGDAILTENFLRGRDLLSVAHLSAEEIRRLFATAHLLKNELSREAQRKLLAGKTLAMIFEKPSLRTRVTFEAGMTQLGGHAIYLGPQDAQIGKRETVADAARNMARWVDGIMARTFEHQTVTGLAEHASIPVINGLSDLEHPCQALADFLTIKEKKGKFAGLKLVYVGDGNNVCNSLMLLSAKLGVYFVATCPRGYEPNSEMTRQAREIAENSEAQIEIVGDPLEAVKNADALYTDVWASMGQEHEAEERKRVFAAYQVNQRLVDQAKDDVIVLHCLPAHRGEEITDEVLDGPHSVVLDEAENRLYAQKALMALML